jgi:uncharacterized protein involved in response to NO
MGLHRYPFVARAVWRRDPVADRVAAIGWHAHEMTFGFAAATVAGFMLTAIPNWTGRMPLQGVWLGLLVLAWFA